jgi:sugar O-acyltransferase (sialic acid O-acetyltransferase NeuD family)
MDKPVIILGAGGIGKAAYEIFRSHNLIIYCFLDDREELHGTEIDEVSVLGRTDDDGYLKLIGQKCEAFVATDNIKERQAQVKMLLERRKVMPVNAIHKHAHLAVSSGFAHGNFINDSVVIGANVEIGNHNLIHSGSIIEFDTRIGDFVQIGPGAIIGSGVSIKDGTFIGAGATLVSGIKIGKTARIGAGSVVINDIKSGETVFGNPAKTMEL